MANRDNISRSGKGSELSSAEHDQNLKSLAGTVEEQTGTTYTVVYTDQNKTIELNNASMVCTLTAISTIHSQIDTDNFTVTLVNTNSTAATVNRGGSDTFSGGGTSFTLNQYSWIVIQTDSTGAIWNIISHGNSAVLANSTAGTIVTTGDYKTAGSGGVITDNDFATGTVTFSSIAATTNSGQTDVAHGLGTDDIDFGFSLRFDGTIANLDEITGLGVTANDAAVWNGRDGKTMPNPVSTPSAGEIGFNVRNNHGTAHTIYVDWWARIR